eukprot:1446435-Pyramimonas_sp.AAC.1
MAPDAPRRPPEATKRLPRSPVRPPLGPQEAPRGPQGALRERPRGPPTHPNKSCRLTAFRGHGSSSWAREFPEALK